ncbi:MAG: hypothetical protein R2845_11705 [Thermomicrobiales bacterium]
MTAFAGAVPSQKSPLAGSWGGDRDIVDVRPGDDFLTFDDILNIDVALVALERRRISHDRLVGLHLDEDLVAINGFATGRMEIMAVRQQKFDGRQHVRGQNHLVFQMLQVRNDHSSGFLS